MLLNLRDYTICDSWNTYHVIKSVQVDPFVSRMHFELPDGDNHLSLRRGQQRRAQEGGGRWLSMNETVFNAGGVFCMVLVGQGS